MKQLRDRLGRKRLPRSWSPMQGHYQSSALARDKVGLRVGAVSRVCRRRELDGALLRLLAVLLDEALDEGCVFLLK